MKAEMMTFFQAKKNNSFFFFCINSIHWMPLPWDKMTTQRCLVFYIYMGEISPLHCSAGNEIGQCLLIKKYFCVIYDYVGKADLTLSKGF